MSKQKTAIRRPDYVMALLGKAMTFMQQKDVPLDEGGTGASARAVSSEGLGRRGKETSSRIDTIRDACSPALAAFFKENPWVMVISISALDGFEIMSLARDAEFKSARFSVITNALATIGRAVTTEFTMGQSDFTLISSSQGRIVTMHLTAMGMGFVLALIASDDATLGGLLVSLKNICNKLILVLDEVK